MRTKLRLNGIRHFIIDEYQDLTGIRATLVLRLLEILAAGNDDCGFTVLCDPDQAIHDWSIEEQGNEICLTSRDLLTGSSQLLERNLSKSGGPSNPT